MRDDGTCCEHDEPIVKGGQGREVEELESTARIMLGLFLMLCAIGIGLLLAWCAGVL